MYRLATVVLAALLFACPGGSGSDAGVGDSSSGNHDGAGSAPDEPDDEEVLGVCSVTLRIELPGMVIDGAQVDLIPHGGETVRTLGKCDSDGNVSGEAPAWKMAHVRIGLAGGVKSVHPDVILELTADGHVQRDVRFEFASARLKFPEGLRFPDSGSLRVSFRSTEKQFVPFERTVSFKDARVEWPIRGLREEIEGTLALGALPVGTYEMALRIVDNDGEFSEIQLDDGESAWVPVPTFERTRVVELALGDPTTVVL